MIQSKKALRIYRSYKDGDDQVFSVKEKKDDKGRPFFETEDGKRLFTQEHMSVVVGEARTSARSKIEEEKAGLIEELRTLRKSEEEKGNNVTALSDRIKELEDANLSVEDRYKRDQADWEKKLSDSEKTRKQEVDQWRARYEDEQISTGLMNAAVKHGAVSFETLAPFLRGNTKVQEIVDPKTKQVIGYKPTVAFEVIEDGKPVRKDFAIDDAVAEMRKDTTRFGHLFKKDIEGGSGSATLYGGSADGGGTPANTPQVGGSMDEYAKWAEKAIPNPNGGM